MMSADIGDVEPEHGPNIAYHDFRIPVPRDPSCYAPSTHFLSRRKYRKNPSLKDWMLEDIIKEGQIHGTKVEDRYRFEKEVWSEGKHRWNVVVAVRPIAYFADEQYHKILTAYTDAHGEPDEI